VASTLIPIIAIPVSAVAVALAAIVPIPMSMPGAIIVPVMALMPMRRSGMPVRGRIAQEVDRLPASMVATTVAAPVARVTRRHPHVQRLRLRYDRPTPHGLRIDQRRRRSVANIDLTIDTRCQLPGDGATDIGLRLHCRSDGQP